VLFDRYVAVDWSASATPTTGKDSIWIADQRRDGSVELSNPSTRGAAASVLSSIVDAGGRTLVGVDASLGYPSGTAELFGFGRPPWRSSWHEIARRSTDDDRNRNNRFDVAADLNELAGSAEGPFWGSPSEAFGHRLRRTKPASFEVEEFRAVERRLRAAGRHPKSCWQLLGAGSVGGQTLTLLPILDALLDRIEVWPFTTGLTSPVTDVGVVVVEIWPTLFTGDVPVGMIRDAAQVSATVRALHAADRSGDLRQWFEPTVDDIACVEREEGWILGVA
jgi:precorrin-8X/cobalt-precorrin-8 methylmutase